MGNGGQADSTVTPQAPMHGLYFAAYDFATKYGGLKSTPAVAAGISSEPWTVAELIERTAAYNSPAPPTGLDRFLDSLPDE
jgi:hypothetical protein